jgi:hypothetical protein
VEEPFFQLLNVHRFNDLGQIEIHTSDPLVAEPSAFEVQMAAEQLKKKTHKSPGTDQIPAELIEARG